MNKIIMNLHYTLLLQKLAGMESLAMRCIGAVTFGCSFMALYAPSFRYDDDKSALLLSTLVVSITVFYCRTAWQISLLGCALGSGFIGLTSRRSSFLCLISNAIHSSCFKTFIGMPYAGRVTFVNSKQLMTVPMI